MRWLAVALGLGLASCGAPSYVELQVADDRLPFLAPGADFDQLHVEARSPVCAPVVASYPAAPLPATLTVVQGDCFALEVELQASALLAGRRVAESRWLGLTFPGKGGLVATATLAAVTSSAAGAR